MSVFFQILICFHKTLMMLYVVQLSQKPVAPIIFINTVNTVIIFQTSHGN